MYTNVLELIRVLIIYFQTHFVRTIKEEEEPRAHVERHRNILRLKFNMISFFCHRLFYFIMDFATTVTCLETSFL